MSFRTVFGGDCKSCSSHVFCGGITLQHVGQTVVVPGWVHNKRDHGQLMFVDLRDRSGVLQCVTEDERSIEVINGLACESVVRVTGVVQPRCNQSGVIELRVSAVEVLAVSEPVPFAVNRDLPIADELKSRYRFLYLRRRRMLNNLELRAAVIRYVRDFMYERGFLEVQTPILTCPAPEGARDFLVPARKHPGKFYALPQAPQIFKQLLIASGIDRYFQIAPCFRDEDSRADRLVGEFYQIDLEMAFAKERDVIQLILELLLEVFAKFKPESHTLDTRIKYISYDEAIKLYGTDKPDLRNPMQFQKLEVFKTNPPKVFSKAVSNDGITLGMVVPDRRVMTVKFFEQCKELVVANDGPGLVFVGKNKQGLMGNIVNTFSLCQKRHLENILSEGEGMLILSMYPSKYGYKIMGLLRELVWDAIKTPEDEYQFKFACVTDMPMFERDDDGKIVPAHNPFSMPSVSESEFGSVDPEEVKSRGYDIVCNGFELGSGSIRNHTLSYFFKVLALLGYSRDRGEFEFGALVDAFQYGTPPHGGIALGLERILMLLSGEKNVREVCAMPLTPAGEDRLLRAPRSAMHVQLDELQLAVNLKPAQSTPPKSVTRYFEEYDPAAEKNTVDRFFDDDFC